MPSCLSTPGAGAGRRKGPRSTPRRTIPGSRAASGPQYYLTICDISSARAVLANRFGVPVYAVGGSNGGRYAAVAAGVDPKFAGYVGISTADWGLRDMILNQGGSGDILRFATSLEPSTYLPGDLPTPGLDVP